ncbi:MAG: aspartate aminotransferase family protein [Chloroflexi bacterium]|nr:aspartate aminotransferase family protein [Chloroflexota bacterium]
MSSKKHDRIYSGATPEEIATDLAPLVDFQEQGVSLDELSSLIDEHLIPHLVKYDHPGFHSLYNFFLEEGAELGARVALPYNQGVTNYQVSPGAVMLEELCGKALCRLFGFPPGSDATFAYSGTYANQQALYMALHWKAEQQGVDFAEKGLLGFRDPSRLTVVCSEEAHFSLRQALRVMGLGEQSLKTVAVDGNRRMGVDALQETLEALRKTHDVFCVVPTAGTSSTGSVDPVAPVVDLCQNMEIWVHVDAAYGMIYGLLPEKSALFSGAERADSVCWDPHKQFGVPIPSSLLFARRGEDLYRMAIYGEYFNRPGESVPNPGLKSLPSTRPFSALPLVASIRHQGMERLRQRLRAPFVAIRTAIDYVNSVEDIELMHEPDLGIFCIRLVPPGFPVDELDQLQKYIYDRVMAEGRRSVSMTSIDGRTALRFLVISLSVTGDALLETFVYLRALARDYAET